jgi:hypothetical protein
MAMLKPDRLNIRIVSIMVGQTLHIGCCVTGLSATGRWRVDHLQAPDPGEGEIVARSETRGEVDRNTSFTPGSDTVREIEPFHCGRGRVWRSRGRFNRPPRSFAR